MFKQYTIVRNFAQIYFIFYSNRLTERFQAGFEFTITCAVEVECVFVHNCTYVYFVTRHSALPFRTSSITKGHRYELNPPLNFYREI